jgi:PhoH-like ATPase
MTNKKSKSKIFVLDTSVILFDHLAVKNFQDNDIVIPIIVLEELDTFKKGNDTVNYEARQFIRFIDNVSMNQNLNSWIKIDPKKPSKLKVYMNSEHDLQVDATKVFGDRKNDHLILNATLATQKENPDRAVILVTKDMNLRIKARSLGLISEDYETGKIKDVEGLYKGITQIEWSSNEAIEKFHSNRSVHYSEILESEPYCNSFLLLKNNKNSALAYYNKTSQVIEKVEKITAYGIKPKNAEQTFAMHALFNPEIKLVTIQGVAGTGKTLLALASAIEQRSMYRQIYLARPIVPLSNKDIGYLPGDANQKINPYMEPLWDNLKLIQNQFKETSKDSQRITEMIQTEKLLVTPLAYIRGRSLSNIMFIVDEAQNLTPLEIKTIITRAGEGTKIVFTGDIYQIDTPYLDTQSNGLSYLIDRFKNQAPYAHITLEKGERSGLANLANTLL